MQQHLHGLEEWCRSHVHLGRGNMTSSSAVTWANSERSIAAFLGFVHRILSVTFCSRTVPADVFAASFQCPDCGSTEECKVLGLWRP